MKNLLSILVLFLIIIGCSTTSRTIKRTEKNSAKVLDTIRIANNELEYEVNIIDSGFSTWLASQAQPRGFYGESYLESRNKIYVNEWNNSILQPQLFNPNLYEMQINYDPLAHYGYEVNYLIYNYFIHFQLTYKQQLSGFVPR